MNHQDPEQKSSNEKETPPVLLTPAEAAKRKGVSRAAIYAAIAEERLPHVRVLGRIGVREEDLAAWTPVQYGARAGRKGGRPEGIPMSEEARARISETQKRQWAQKKQSKAD